MSLGAAPGVEQADEYPHETTGADRWTENLQWNVLGPNGVGVIWHAGTMLRDPNMWHVVVAVTLSDGRTLAAKIVADGADGVFGPSVAHLATIEPFKRWRLSYRAGMVDVSEAQWISGLLTDESHTPVRIELDLQASHPVWVPAGSDAHLEWGRFHHEQAVRASGTITVDGVEHRLDGVGHRDHSVGPRDMGNLQRAFWGNGTFESGWSFATMWGDYGADDFQRAAVFDDIGHRDARMLSWSRIDDPSGAPHEFAVVLDVDGQELEIVGRCLGGMNFTVLDGAEFGLGTDLASPERYLLTGRLAEWSCNGERGQGYIDRGALIGVLASR